MLDVVGLSKRYGPIRALDDVSVTVDAGEVVALVGENGAGKSTLVKCVARDTMSDAGMITLGGVDLGRTPRDAIQQGVSVVWQDLALCENLDVTANLFLGRELSRGVVLRQAAMHSRVERIFDGLNVSVPGLDRPIERLSGGQRQLVAIARATLDLPKLLILDEPTAALGIAESRTVLTAIKVLQSRGVAILLVSHQLDEVFEVADRIVVLRHGGCVGDLRRAEIQVDDVVALITGTDVDTSAAQQIRRLHSLSEQLAEADRSSVLPLTVSSLSGALNVDRLAVFLTSEEPEGSVLRHEASLLLPDEMERKLTKIPFGPTGGFVGRAAAEASLVVVPRLQELAADPVASAAMPNGLIGGWAAPIVGQAGTLAVIVGFTDVVAYLQPDQVRLLGLFSTMAGVAIDRGQLVETLRSHNLLLEGLQSVLLSLAGPDSVSLGMSSALDALCSGVECDFASLLASTESGAIEEKATSSGLDKDLRVQAKDSISQVFAGEREDPNVEIIDFEWSQGSGALACFWQNRRRSGEVSQMLDGVANTFRLALERDLKSKVEQEAIVLKKGREAERYLRRRLGHELRTPLTAIRGFSSTMLQSDVEWPAEDKERFLQIIDRESARMGRLVDQLFDDSAIESGTLRLDFNYCDLALLINQAASIVGSPDRIRTTTESSTVWGDQDRLEQVFVNLVDNALRHNAEDTMVTVSIDRPEPDDSSVVVVVSDDGSGLPEDVAGYLDGSIEELSAKHGLGIRLVRGFVRAHGGCIRVASNHHGTQIHIELPIEPETK